MNDNESTKYIGSAALYSRLLDTTQLILVRPFQPSGQNNVPDHRVYEAENNMPGVWDEGNIRITFLSHGHI